MIKLSESDQNYFSSEYGIILHFNKFPGSHCVARQCNHSVRAHIKGNPCMFQQRTRNLNKQGRESEVMVMLEVEEGQKRVVSVGGWGGGSLTEIFD